LTESTLLSDEILQQLIAVGQVDILVGVPTLDNAATVGHVASVIHESFATDFARERTVLLNCDAGSQDGTPEIVQNASLKDDETLVAHQSLRTIHRISAPYHGLPGKSGALKTLFAAAELLQARAVAVFDPDVTSINPTWIERMVRPVYEGRADFVAPVFARHPLDGLLVTQLVRPVVRAAYSHRVHEPLAAEFACSGAFATHCREQDVWDGPLARYGLDLWLTGTALSGGFRCVETPLEQRTVAPAARRPALAEVFRQVVGSLFGCLEAHSSYWLPRTRAEALPVFGATPDVVPEHSPVDPQPLLDTFRSGARDLAPILTPILKPETLAALTALSAETGPETHFPDALWRETVYEAVAAYHHGAMHREHLVQALVPLYEGRAASFLIENQGRPATEVEESLETLAVQFEEAKPDLVERWAPKS
jgi:glucosylglycerate synthase